MFMSIVLWAQVAVFTHVMSYDVDGTGLVLWVELPIQGRLYPIFLSQSGYPTFTSIPQVDG